MLGGQWSTAGFTWHERGREVSEPYVGQIFTFPYWTPDGFSPCNGQVLNVQQYTALFSLIGAVFGGNGSSTFGLPNLNGRVIVGTYNGGVDTQTTHYVMGNTGGHESVALNQNNLAPHAHGIQAQATGNATISISSPVTLDGSSLKGVLNVCNSTATSPSPAPSAAAPSTPMTLGKAGAVAIYVANTAGNAIQLPAVGISGTLSANLTASPTVALNLPVAGNTTTSGGGLPFDTRMPFLALNQVIATTGLYPTRP